jgi:RimJ/RimL family protein N-acetyltransferase
MEKSSSNLVLFDRDRVGLWVANEVGQTGDWGSFNAFGVEVNGELVAGVVVNNINGANATAHIAIAKPTKLVFQMFRVFCDYCFNQLGLLRITGMVPTDEPATIAFDKRLGFEEEFIMKHGALGADMQFLVMWHDKCPWRPDRSL